MKIIHTADLHLDSKLANFNAQKAKERNEELVKNFEDLVNVYAKENQVGCVIIAGDLFDTNKSAKKITAKRILSLVSSNPKITFFYLRGNHDAENIFSQIQNLPSNLKFFSEKNWTLYTTQNICIAGREFFSSIPDSAYKELKLDEKKFNLVVLHAQISSGKNDEVCVDLKKLAGKNIDYLALGHIHSFESGALDERGIWSYSGCLEGRGFDECGKKGFVLLNISQKNQFEKKFVPFAKREIIIKEIDVSHLTDFCEFSETLKANLENLDSKNIVRVVLRGQIDENAELEPEILLRQFENKFYHFEIENKTQTKIDFSKYENDFSLKGEFVRVVKKSDLAEEEKISVIQAGLKALAGKDL